MIGYFGLKSPVNYVYFKMKKKGKKRRLQQNALFNTSATSSAPRTANDISKDRIKAQEMKELQKAKKITEKMLKENPNIFEFDAVPEKIVEIKNSKGKESIYISKLKENAKHREFMYEQAMDKVIQKEQLEEEKIIGKATEVFVTSAYKRRLDERKTWESEEEKRKLDEEANSVVKKKNLNGFYCGLINSLTADTTTLSQPTKPPITESKNIENPSKVAVSAKGGGEEKKLSYKLGEKTIRKRLVVNKTKVSESIIEAAKRRALDRKLNKAQKS